MYATSTSDIDADLDRLPGLVRLAVAGLLEAAATDPTSWGNPVGVDPDSGFRFHHFIAASRRFDLYILVVEWQGRIDALRLREISAQQGQS